MTILERQKVTRGKFMLAVIIILVAALTAGAALTELGRYYAEAKAGTPKGYISDVKVFRAYDESDAADKARKHGYTPVKGNLNEGTDKDAVVMAYKETKEKSKAVTDIRMMQMSSGFSKMKYAEIVEREYPRLNTAINEEYQMVSEFAANYNKGIVNATMAKEYMDLFEIPEMNMKLGDYLASDKVSKDMLKKMLLQTTMGFSAALYQYLAMGVSLSGDDSWAAKIKTSTLKKEMEDSGNYTEYDNKYLADTQRFVKALQEFASKYENAMARVKANGGKLKPVSKDDGDHSNDPESDGDGPFIMAYEVLNQFEYEDEVKLGEFLVAMGSEPISKKSDYRELYPIVASMTKGQLNSICMAGLHSAAINLSDLSKAEDEQNKSIKKAQDLAKDYNGKKSVPVWAGVDQDLYKQEVAMTGDAQRYTNIQSSYENLSKRNVAIEGLEVFIEYAGIASSIAGGVAALFAIPKTILGTFSAKTAAAWIAAHKGGAKVIMGLGKVAAKMGKLSTYVLIATLIVLLIVWIYESTKPEDDDLEYTAIPNMVIALSEENKESGKNGMLRYDLISDPDGKADLNAYSGKQWNALYMSVNPDAGDPIPVYEGEDPFVIQYGDSTVPAKYSPVRNFDEITAANMNAYTRKDKVKGIYAFYRTEEQEEQPVEEPAGDDKGKDKNKDKDKEEKNSNVKYISSLKVNSADNETEAKNKLKNEGYQVVDNNLGSNFYEVGFFGQKQKRKYTYLGFKITKHKNNAITDIRMAKIQSKTDQIQYGNIAYTAAGFDNAGNSICYTPDKNAGSPIIADIQVVDEHGKVKDGYEFVSYFGGTPYNFCANKSFDRWETKKYLAFRTSAASKSKEKYVSGLFFVTGRNTNQSKYDLDNYIKELGGNKLSDTDLNRGRTLGYRYNGVNSTASVHLKNIKTYLCYTTTNDPKRAIYDAALYIGTQKHQMGQPFINAMTGTNEKNTTASGYAATSVYTQNHYAYISNNTAEKYDAEDLVRYEAPNNFYNDLIANIVGTQKWFSRDEDNVLPGVKWKRAGVQARTLYVSGYKKGYEPLKVSDVVMNDNDKAPKGFASVQDFKYPYETKSINLAHYESGDSGNCNKAYLYLKKEQPKRPKYISSICVSTYEKPANIPKEAAEELDDEAHDNCMTNVLGGSSGGVLNINLSSKQDETWFSKKDGDKASKDYPAKAAYIGVSRTDNPNKALKGLLRYVQKGNKTPPDSIKVGGIEYSKVKNIGGGNKPIVSDNGEKYHLYQSTSIGASPMSAPITEMSFDDEPLISGGGTVLTVDQEDTEEKTDRYGKVIAEGKETRPYGDMDEDLFLHLTGEDNLTGIDSFYVGRGSNEKKAKVDLLSKGATSYMNVDMNKSAAGDCVFIGSACL